MKAKLVLSRILGGRAQTFAIAAMVGFTGLILGLQRAPGGPNNIVIKDSKGQKRIEIGMFNDRPAILVYSGKGRECIRLGIDAEEGNIVGGTLQFFRDESKAACMAELCATRVGEGQGSQASALRLSGQRGSGMAMEAGVMPELEIRGAEPEQKSSLTLNVLSGSPCIVMKDKHGKDRLLTRLAIDGSPHIVCKDKAEKTVWQAPPEADKPSSDKPKNDKQEKSSEEE